MERFTREIGTISNRIRNYDPIPIKGSRFKSGGKAAENGLLLF